MVGALAKYLAQAGQQVGVVTPLYSGIRERFPHLRPGDIRITLPLGSRHVQADVWTLEVADRLVIYFIDQPDFYRRATLYQHQGVDYPDNAERFLFLSKCVAHLARNLPWKPELVHVHDWQVGLVPLFIRHQRLEEGWVDAPKTCLTIHNQAYQGHFGADAYEWANLPLDYFEPNGVEFYGGLNCLKAGIVYADRITTVSPRYAREITTEALGNGLDGVLRLRQGVLAGILNGVDYDEWNTTDNPFLKHSFAADSLEGKATSKLDLQRELGLPEASHLPLFGTVTRLVEQKGVDIQLSALEEMLAAEMQFVLLGSGESQYEKAYKKLSARYPTKVAVKIGYDHGLSHRIEAGCDFYLMPSKFEPCGLNQLYSLRYGTIPIVRATGGLDDSIIDLAEDVERATGIKFAEYSSSALVKAIRKGLILFEHSDLLLHLRTNGMSADFSWEKTAQKYLKLFDKILSE